jgi:glycosyltransferase involved in cell wall biosynthesis
MRHLDVLVLPSRFEGFPNVLLEAMASRLPAVATPAGDVPSLMEDGRTGFLVPLGDAAALARALERLEDMGPEGRRALGERARTAVEQRYRIEVVAEQHLALYRRLLAAGTG